MKFKIYKNYFLLFTLSLSFILLCVGCGKSASTDVTSPESSNEEASSKQPETATTSSETETENIEGAYADYPVYFQEILHEYDEKGHAETKWDTSIYAPQISTENEYDYTNFELNHPFAYNIKEWKVAEGKIIKDAYIDLSEYKSGGRRWSHDTAFYNEANDMVYLVAVPFPRGLQVNATDEEKEEYERQIKTNILLMLVEFPFSDPTNYNVTLFTSDDINVGGAWFHYTYHIGNILYKQSDFNDLWAIDLDTKEMQYLGAQRDLIEKTITEYATPLEADGINLDLHGLHALEKKGDIVIYSGNATDRYDWDIYGPIYSIYLAYDGDTLLGSLVINESTGDFDYRNMVD